MRIIFFIYALLCSAALPARTLHIGSNHPWKSIREALAAAEANDTLVVYGGYFAEGQLIVDKRVALIGVDYPVLDGKGQDEILTVQASGVTIRGFEICNSGIKSTIDVAGIKVLAVDSVRIEDNVVRACNFGIYLSNTRYCSVRCNTLIGARDAEHNTGNGIHLWKCEYALVEGNSASKHRDGIYFEFVTESLIRDNYSTDNLRYGLHFMFSHRDRYEDNIFENNGAGVAVMYSRQVDMHRNRFMHNWGASAYGILLKEISDGSIQNNLFEGNSAGMYIEGASRIKVEYNLFNQNGWALRVQASCNESTFEKNNFRGNTFDVATNGQTVLNSFNGNYWDRYEGYDLNRDGVGDVPYRPVSLYAMVVEQMPAGLILMRSFMVALLDKVEKVIPSLSPEHLIDQKPAMHPLPLNEI